jgi:hypothetical protein
MKALTIGIVVCALTQLTVCGQDIASTYISAAQKLEAAAGQTTDSQQRASYLQQAQQYRDMAAQLGTANSGSPVAFSSPNNSSLDAFARQQAQLRQMQQQQQEAQQRLQTINAANQRIQGLNNTRDSINGAIGSVGNMLLQQMQRQNAQDAQDRLEQKQQRDKERVQREQDAIQKQIEDQQREIENFKNRQQLSFDDQPVATADSGPLTSLVDLPQNTDSAVLARSPVNNLTSTESLDASAVVVSLLDEEPIAQIAVATRQPQQDTASIMADLLDTPSIQAAAQTSQPQSNPSSKDNLNQSARLVLGELLDQTISGEKVDPSQAEKKVIADQAQDAATDGFISWFKQQPISNGKSWNDLPEDERDFFDITGDALKHGVSVLRMNVKGAYESGIQIMNKSVNSMDKITQDSDEK